LHLQRCSQQRSHLFPLPFIPHHGLDPSDCTIHEHSQYMREFLDDIFRHLLDSLLLQHIRQNQHWL
jgi:hypothetical protein